MFHSGKELILEMLALKDSLWWLIYIINSIDETKQSCYTPHSHSTTVSLETYPLHTYILYLTLYLPEVINL